MVIQCQKNTNWRFIIVNVWHKKKEFKELKFPNF